MLTTALVQHIKCDSTFVKTPRFAMLNLLGEHCWPPLMPPRAEFSKRFTQEDSKGEVEKVTKQVHMRT